jgi:hypothetical protein
MAYQYPFTYADEQLKVVVWQKGTIVPGYDPNVWRVDRCRNWMNYPQHGNRSSQYGWEIDHIMPLALGGPNTFDNLQPLNWNNNAAKGDIYPWSCV